MLPTVALNDQSRDLRPATGRCCAGAADLLGKHPGIALALGSSLVYGVSDFLGGMKSRALPLLWVLLVSQGSALALLALIVVASGEGPPSGSYLAYAALAGLGEAVGVAALYRGLAVGVMSIVAPIAGTAPVVPVVVAGFLGELPAPIQGVGIVLALAGIAVVSWGKRPDERPPVRCPPGEVPGSAPSRRRLSPEVGTSILFGLLTALGFGGFLVGMDAASEGGVAWALLVARLASMVAFATAYLVRRPPLAVRPAELPVLALIGFLIIGADWLYAVATTEGLLSVVVVLSSLYPVVTIALARVYLNERLQRLQQVGVAATLCGAVAIAAP
jgi:drug/metabolite transporter (DMT)-like permease